MLIVFSGTLMIPIKAEVPSTLESEFQHVASEPILNVSDEDSVTTESIAGKVRLYDLAGKPVKALIWSYSTFHDEQLSDEISSFIPFDVETVTSKTGLFETLNDSSALLIMESSETNGKQLTEEEVSVILNWVSKGNFLLISDHKTLNASKEFMNVFGIESLAPVAPNPLVTSKNVSIWTVNVSKITPISHNYYNQVLYAGGISSYGLNLLNDSKSEVIANYIQPDTSRLTPAVLLATYGKGTALCLSPDILTTITQKIDHRWMHVIREAVDDYTHLLAYLFLKPQEFVDPVSPFVIPMSQNDTLFKKSDTIAKYLNGLGFSISYTNLAHSTNETQYHSRLSVSGPTSLFDTTFNTSIRTIYSTTVGHTNATAINFPDKIRNEIRCLELTARPLLFQWPPGWFPLPQLGYYHLSPNEDAAHDMGSDIWVPHSVENAVGALQQRQTWGYDGSGVDVAVIDTGFSQAPWDWARPYNTITGYHPFYDMYYRDLLQNRYVDLTYGGIDPDNDFIGHGTGIISNLLAVAPGIDLTFIPWNDPFTAMDLALNENVDVVSCSWGFTDPEVDGDLTAAQMDLEDTINQLAADGAIVVFAAGNNGTRGWPASMPNVVSVGGTYVDQNNNFQASDYASSFDSVLYRTVHVPDLCGIVGQSPYGILIEMPTQPQSDYDGLFAVVGDMTALNDGWLVASGTSSATPQVAGLAAICKQLDPTIDVNRFRYCAGLGAIDITAGNSANDNTAHEGYDLATGYGLINVSETVRRIVEADLPRLKSYKFVPSTETEIFSTSVCIEPGEVREAYIIDLQSTQPSLVLLKIRLSRQSTDYFAVTFRTYDDLTVYMGTSDSYMGYGQDAGAQYSPVYDRYIMVPNDQKNGKIYVSLIYGAWRNSKYDDDFINPYLYIYKLGEFIPEENPQTGYRYRQFSQKRFQFSTWVPLSEASGSWSFSNAFVPSNAEHIVYQGSVHSLSSDWISLQVNSGPTTLLGTSDSHDPAWLGEPRAGAYYSPCQSELCFAPYSSSPWFSVGHGGWYNALVRGQTSSVRLLLEALGYFSQSEGEYLRPSYGETYGFWWGDSGWQQPQGSRTITVPSYMRDASGYIVLASFNRMADWFNWVSINGIYATDFGTSNSHYEGGSPMGGRYAGSKYNPVNTKMMFVPNKNDGELQVMWSYDTHELWWDWKGTERDRGVQIQILGYFMWPQNDANMAGDAGDDFNNARDITGNLIIDLPGYANSAGDPEDWYQFLVSSGWTITVDMTPPPGHNFDLYLYNPSGSQVASSTNTGDTPEHISYPNAVSGYYRIKIVTVDEAIGEYSFKYQLTLPGSCPFLYVWNGSKFVLMADVIGPGGLAYPDVSMRYDFRPPNPHDFAVIPGEMLQAVNGYYVIELAEPRSEISYIDGIRLIAVDHPIGYEIYSPTVPTQIPLPFEYRTVYDPISPITATKYDYYWGNLTNITDILEAVTTPDDLNYAVSDLSEAHVIELDFGDLGDLDDISEFKLITRGWSVWDSEHFSEEIWWMKEHPELVQANYIEVINENGEWETVGEPICNESFWLGHGAPRTTVRDIRHWLKTSDYRLRLHYWGGFHLDWIAVDITNTPLNHTTFTILRPTVADLHYKGGVKLISKEGDILGQYPALPDWDIPYTYDTELFIGYFTRYGNVKPLLLGSDDMFVIMNYGDSIHLEFPEVPVPEGMERHYYFFVDGFFKETFVKYFLNNTVSTVDPLPFHDMTTYPYPENESYPNDLIHRAYLKFWNTRYIGSEKAARESSSNFQMETTIGINSQLDASFFEFVAAEEQQPDQTLVNLILMDQKIDYNTITIQTWSLQS